MCEHGNPTTRARPVCPLLLAPLLAGLGAGLCAGQATELQKLVASDGEIGDKMGYSVAISGDVIVAGAYDESYLGAAYVYRFDGTSWPEEQKLVASNAGPSAEYFGWSVGVSGDQIVVGAWRDDDGGPYSGSAFVFFHDGTSWIEEQKLTASDAQSGAQFAWSVAIDGDVIACGASELDVGGTDRGAVYMFRRDPVLGWQEEQKLVAPVGIDDATFGYSVSVDGDTVLVGAPRDHVNGWPVGTAYLYRHVGGTWVLEDRLVALDFDIYGDQFGISVSLAGDVALIGAPRDSDRGNDLGAAYVFRYNGGASWPQEQKLIADDSAIDDRFGWSVSTSGTHAVVGAQTGDAGAVDCGAVYSFDLRRTTWAQDVKYAPSAPDTLDYFGWSVAMDGNRAVAGAQYDDTVASTAGCVYVLGVDEFVLAADPASVAPGDTLTLTSRHGQPVDPIALAVVGVSGIPMFQILWWDLFGSDYQYTYAASVPGGLAGLTVDFMTLKLDVFSRARLSNLERVLFL